MIPGHFVSFVAFVIALPVIHYSGGLLADLIPKDETSVVSQDELIGKSVAEFGLKDKKYTEEGEKIFSLKYVQLIKVEGEEAKHPILDNLSVSNSSRKIKYQSLTQSINKFLQLYPNGFYGEKYHKTERNYKIKAHKLASELLNSEDFEKFLHELNYDEICKRALTVANASNLVFPKEKKSLKDGLSTTTGKKHFSESLYQLLYGTSDFAQRFNDFSKVLKDIGTAKWTTISYFLFIVFPEKYMFVKPKMTEHAAEISAFEINYDPELNWLTYNSILTFSEYLKKELSELQLRDMIDVQSFMWCIAKSAT